MTPCRPMRDRITPTCRLCSRLNEELPHDPELRGVVLIDASMLRKGENCPMFADGGVPAQAWWDEKDEAAA